MNRLSSLDRASRSFGPGFRCVCFGLLSSLLRVLDGLAWGFVLDYKGAQIIAKNQTFRAKHFVACMKMLNFAAIQINCL